MKKWERPFLQVIVRNKPEEAVLGACKIAGNTTGSTNYFNFCWTVPTGMMPCDECKAPGLS